MRTEIFNKAQSLKRDLDNIDRLYDVTVNSIRNFDDKKHEINRVQIANIALRDLLFTEEQTQFKEDFKNFLKKEFDTYKSNFQNL